MKLKLTVLMVAVAALGFSAAVFAAPPTGKGKPATTPASTNAAHPSVMYVLHGTITAYTAVVGTTNGSVSLTVTGSNHHAAALKGQTIAFVLSPSTDVVGTPTVGHNATLKWRGTKTPTGTAPAMPGAARQLIDQGSAS
jgi:hypothetical protein